MQDPRLASVLTEMYRAQQNPNALEGAIKIMQKIVGEDDSNIIHRYFINLKNMSVNLINRRQLPYDGFDTHGSGLTGNPRIVPVEVYIPTEIVVDCKGTATKLQLFTACYNIVQHRLNATKKEAEETQRKIKTSMEHLSGLTTKRIPRLEELCTHIKGYLPNE